MTLSHRAAPRAPSLCLSPIRQFREAVQSLLVASWMVMGVGRTHATEGGWF